MKLLAFFISPYQLMFRTRAGRFKEIQLHKSQMVKKEVGTAPVEEAKFLRNRFP
jgi:hypothetical protein